MPRSIAFVEPEGADRGVIPRRASRPRWFVLVALLIPGAARAAEAARVVSGGEKDNPYDLNLAIGFSGASRQALLKREAPVVGRPDSGLTRELIYRHTRQTAHVRADLGLLPDVGLFVNLPFVVSDRRSLEFDQSGEGCPGASGCVDANNSTLLRDGVLPGYGQSSYGLDVPRGGSFQAPSSRVFDGPERSGIEYLGVGLQWAVFNQERVRSEATWILSFESRLSIAKDQRFDPLNPAANTAVGPGYHQLVFGSMGARRFGSLEPYLGGWYMYPVKTAGSVYESQGLGKHTFANPQHRGGVEVGLESAMYEQPRLRHRLVLELRGRAEARFLGLAQAELWEPLTASSACVQVGRVCRALDHADVNQDGTADPHTGVTRSPTYGVFSADLGLSAQVGEHTRFRGLFGLFAEQSRFLTDARSGYALIDAPGRRFFVTRSRGYQFFVEGALLF